MNTARRRRPTPSRDGRLRPGIDALEARLALSANLPIFPVMATPAPTAAVDRGATLAVVSIYPAGGATLGRAPGEITIGFDRPIDPSSLSTDFLIQSANPDGTWASIQSAESLTPDGTGVVLSPAAPLGPGHYRVVPVAGSLLQGTDGSGLAVGDGTVDAFSVRAVGVGMADATELGSPTAGLAVAGSLDPAANPGDVRLYRVELPQGHRWRLGAVVDAGRIGSPLRPALAVFDAAGRPVDVAQEARPGFPSDPYLYVALNPGVYFIGVSGAGNVPGTPGGYDPSTSQVGSALPGLSAGAFRLRLVADPADNPTELAGFNLDAADPTDPVPTGLSLSFGGPIDESAMRGHAGSLIELVDSSGRDYTAHAVGYDEASATLRFVLDQPLPAGKYAIQLGTEGALVDLSGRAPVADGLPAGTLGTFRVAATPAPSDPNDLGPLFLQVAEQGLKSSLTLGPGQATTYRFVVTVPGYYDLETTYHGSAPTIVAHESGQAMPLNPGQAGQAKAHLVYLQAGAVSLVVAGGPGGTSLDWSFGLDAVGFDQLLDNGASGVDALSLRLITPTESTPGPGAGASSSGGSAAAPAPTPAASSAVVASPTSLYLAATVGPVGHPSTSGESVAAVGPVTPSGTASIASAAPGIPQGIVAGPRTKVSMRPAPGSSTTGAEPAEADLADAGGLAIPARLASAPASESPVDPGAFERIASALTDLFGAARFSAGRPGVVVRDDLALASLDRGRQPEGSGDEPPATADLADSLGAGAIAVAIAHSQRQLGRWIERRRGRLALRLARPAPSESTPGPT